MSESHPFSVRQQEYDRPFAAIYCGSRTGHDARYMTLAAEVGRQLALAGWGLVYGAGDSGLMGAVAQSALTAGAPVIGVMSDVLIQREKCLDGLTELHNTQTICERKRVMGERANAFIILPGGVGTWEEFTEVATGRMLELHQKPMILLNFNNYYAGLIQQLRQAVQEGFLDAGELEHVVVTDTAEALVPLLATTLDGWRDARHLALALQVSDPVVP